MFGQLIADEIKGKSPGDALKFLEQLKIDATVCMTLLYIEMLNELNLAQVFLWFQEKDIMISTMMYNSCPGVNFRACDMVRNLVLSTYMSRPLQTQEKVLRENWLMPFEIPYKNKMDEIMTAFVDHALGTAKGRYVSGMER